MKHKILSIVRWILPAALAVLGVFLYANLPTNFLGLVCFALAALISLYFGISILSRRHLMAGKLLYSILTGLLCLGLLAVSVTGAYVARDARGGAGEACPYIIVLGAKVNGTEPSRILQARIDAAYAYLTEHPDAIAVLSGGQGADEGISEAECMFQQLTDMGIPAQRLWLEEASTSTWENIEFSLALIEEKTGSRPALVGLVTSEFHLLRAGLFARDLGAQAVGIPAETDNVLHLCNYFLREIAGVWHYFILGG